MRWHPPVDAARSLKSALRGADAPRDTTVDEEVGFLLLADLIQMVRDLHSIHTR